MSQSTLAYRVRRTRPQPSKTEPARSYPKRERKQTPTVLFTAVPLHNDDPVLQPLHNDDPVLQPLENRTEKDSLSLSLGVGNSAPSEKSPGKRLCIDPPGKYIIEPPGKYIIEPPGKYIIEPPGKYIIEPPGKYII